MAFASLVTAQLLHALTCRPRRRDGSPSQQSNSALTGILGLSFAVQLAALLVPGLRRLLGIVPIAPLDAVITLGAGVGPYVVLEALKQANGGARQLMPGPA